MSTLTDLLTQFPLPWHLRIDQGGCSLWPAMGDDDTFIASGLSDVEAERIVGVVNGLNEKLNGLAEEAFVTEGKLKAAEVERETWGNEFNAVMILKDHLNKAEQHATQLQRALADMFALIDEGWLGRDTSHDHEPGWAIKQIPFVQRLAEAKKALEGGGA